MKTLNFRMEHNTDLNVAGDFDGYLVCQMPADTVEVKLMIKMTRGKYTLNKDTCTRTGRYHPWDRVDKRPEIHTKRRRTTRREVDSEMVTSNPETDIQNGKGFSYPPEVYTNLDLANTIPLTDTDNDVEVTNPNFIGEFCKECAKKYNRCWCYKLVWDEDLIDVEAPKALTNKSNDPQNLTITVIPKRQPPPGWVEFKRQVTKNKNSDEFRDNNHIEKLIIKGIRSITTKEFKEM